MREKSEKTNEKLETKIGAVMCVYIDANRTLSQLSYAPELFTEVSSEQKIL